MQYLRLTCDQVGFFTLTNTKYQINVHKEVKLIILKNNIILIGLIKGIEL